MNRKANLVITDPPYNVNYEGSAGKIKNDNMADDAFYQFLLAAFQNTEAAMGLRRGPVPGCCSCWSS